MATLTSAALTVNAPLLSSLTDRASRSIFSSIRILRPIGQIPAWFAQHQKSQAGQNAAPPYNYTTVAQAISTSLTPSKIFKHNHLPPTSGGGAPIPSPSPLSGMARCSLALRMMASGLFRAIAPATTNSWTLLNAGMLTAIDAQRRLPFEGVGPRLPNATWRQKGVHAGAERRRAAGGAPTTEPRSDAKRVGHAAARHLTLLSSLSLRPAGLPATKRLLLSLVLAAGLIEPAQSSATSPPPSAAALARSTTAIASASTPLHLAHLPGQTSTKAECLRHGQILSDLNLQLRHATCCRTPGERDLLLVLKQKVTSGVGSVYDHYWAKQAAWRSYDSLGSILVGAGYSKREDFVHCAYCSFNCGDVLFCPRCNYRRLTLRALEEFADAFGADREVWYLVCSVTPDPVEERRFVYRDLNAGDIDRLKLRGLAQVCGPDNYGVPFDNFDDLVQCRLLWQFFGDAMRRYAGNGRGMLFSGAVGGAEVGLRLQPLHVLPHANYVLWSAGLSVDGARQIRHFIRTRMRDSRRIQGGLYPSVAAYRISSADDLRRVFTYSFKPIDLPTAYIMAAERAGFEPAQMAELNRETTRFLTNLLLVHHRLPRLTRFGRCHAGHRAYFGHVSDWRQLQRERNAERRQRACGGPEVLVDASKPPPRRLTAMEKWELLVKQRIGHQVCGRRSRFERWHEAHERRTRPPAPYRMLPSDL